MNYAELPYMIPSAILIVLLPLLSSVLCFLVPRISKYSSLLFAILTSLATLLLTIEFLEGGSQTFHAGGWLPPLGIALKIDGLSVFMTGMTATVALLVGFYASQYFSASKSEKFWPVWMLLWASLNALFISNDLFNFYITLELIGIAAISLTALSDKEEGISATIRYLILALLGSMLFLFGVVIIYHTYYTLDITLLSHLIEDNLTTSLAINLMFVGLALKTALFPLHFWLPSAHANAPAPVSAILSALVVKASFYIIVKIVLELNQNNSAGLTMMGILGACAVVWGAYNAFIQERLKLMIAYSTVAQIGYLFIALYLAQKAGVTAWQAFICLILSHALAKASMFLAAGNLIKACGSDQINQLDRIVHHLPVTTAAFGLAGISIIGLPPSGGFIGKWFLLEAAIAYDEWLIIGVIILGSLLASAYIFKVIGQAFSESSEEKVKTKIPTTMELTSLVLAVAAILVGFLTMPLFQLLARDNAMGIGG